MFLNETLLLLTYTANMMATMPNETTIQNINVTGPVHNITVTTLSPEEEENNFGFEDGEYPIKII